MSADNKQLARVDDIETARLIAAAPDLLQALQVLMSYLDDDPGFFLDGDINRAHAAISKATLANNNRSRT
jgi:hypothetical protein